MTLYRVEKEQRESEGNDLKMLRGMHYRDGGLADANE
jgi:hypothetical protein